MIVTYDAVESCLRGVAVDVTLGKIISLPTRTMPLVFPEELLYVDCLFPRNKNYDPIFVFRRYHNHGWIFVSPRVMSQTMWRAALRAVPIVPVRDYCAKFITEGAARYPYSLVLFAGEEACFQPQVDESVLDEPDLQESQTDTHQAGSSVFVEAFEE